MSLPAMKDLLEAGVHFGHPTRKWDPRMKPFIFQERNDIYIIDLMKTLNYVRKAFDAVKELARNGGNVLFVGTKKQAVQSIKEAAERCDMYYINNRWLGGMLTNFATIKKSIARPSEYFTPLYLFAIERKFFSTMYRLFFTIYFFLP